MKENKLCILKQAHKNATAISMSPFLYLISSGGVILYIL